MTIALEHFTAMFAHEFLAHPEHFVGAETEQAELWRWHAVEEIEHKGVAYDTWLHATRDWSRWKRWKVKSLLMLVITTPLRPQPLPRRERAAGAGRHHRLAREGAAASGTSSAGPASCAACSPRGAPISCPASIPGTTTTAR